VSIWQISAVAMGERGSSFEKIKILCKEAQNFFKGSQILLMGA